MCSVWSIVARSPSSTSSDGDVHGAAVNLLGNRLLDRVFGVEWTRIALLFLPVQSESKTVHRSTSSVQLRRASRAAHGGHQPAGGGLCAVPFLSLSFFIFFNLVRSNLIQRLETLDTSSYDILLKSPPKFLYLHRSPRPKEFPGFNSFI